MARTLKLSISPDPNGGLELTVTHTHKEGDEGDSTTTTERLKDAWAGDAALKQAIESAVADYLGRVRTDGQTRVDESPIGRAARG